MLEFLKLRKDMDFPPYMAASGLLMQDMDYAVEFCEIPSAWICTAKDQGGGIQ